jgi:hypothetical protein
MNSKQIAQIVYEANRAFSEVEGAVAGRPWDSLNDEEKEGIVLSVERLSKSSGASYEAHHNNWLASARESGWKYGPVLNEATRERPCFVPYEQLSEKQKKNARMTVELVRALI